MCPSRSCMAPELRGYWCGSLHIGAGMAISRSPLRTNSKCCTGEQIHSNVGLMHALLQCQRHGLVMTHPAEKLETTRSPLATASRLIEEQSALVGRIAAKGDIRLLQQAWHTLSLLESVRRTIVHNRQRSIARKLYRSNWRR
jgi:hypothetical protein